MYAVLETGGKQYRVSPGDLLRVERLEGEPGSPVRFDRVLLVAEEDLVTIGTPTVAGASVAGEVVRQGRARKIIVFKFKRRKKYRRTQGHRQAETTVRITAISKG
ncbi:MAG TPA: 50S ribosomal protein L21 [Candidatus Methylomirabilis sp.]|nr:50S ribosomal protein L21 [Candidatus Methylomirabilis sp.]